MEARGELFSAWMKIAVNPAVTSSADGSRPSSSRFRALNTPANVPTHPALRSGPLVKVGDRIVVGGRRPTLPA